MNDCNKNTTECYVKLCPSNVNSKCYFIFWGELYIWKTHHRWQGMYNGRRIYKIKLDCMYTGPYRAINRYDCRIIE